MRTDRQTDTLITILNTLTGQNHYGRGLDINCINLYEAYIYFKYNSFALTCVTTSFPKVIWEERVALAQLRSKVSIGYRGTPQIHPQNCPLPSRITTPIQYIRFLVSRPTPLTTPNSIRINQPFCHSTLSRHTHRQIFFERDFSKRNCQHHFG